MVHAWFRKWAPAAAGVILAVLLPLSLSVPVAAATASFGPGTLPGQLACVNATTCYVVGAQSDTWGLTFTLTNGAASTPATVTSVFDIAAIACTSTTACYGDGQIQLGGIGNFIGMVIPITAGSAGSPSQVGGTFNLSGIACVPGTTTCYAVGDSSDNSATSQGQIVPIVGGAVGAASAVAGTLYLSAIACPTASACFAVGSTGGSGVVLPIDPATGKAGTVDVVGTTSALNAITCPTTSYCLLAGIGGTILPLTVSGASITLGAAATVSGVAQWSAIACADTAHCYAAGANAGYSAGVFSVIRDGVPGPATAVGGTTYLTGVACPTLATCVFAGADFVPDTFLGILDTVNRSVTALSASAPSVGLNQPLTLTATVMPRSPATGTPSGSVDFYDGTTLLGSGTLNQASPDQATLTTSSLAQGSHTISAVYTGDDSFFNSAAAALDVTVGRAATTTTVAATPNPSQFGQAVTLSATVAPNAAGGGTPTGTVDFYDGGREIGTGTLNRSTPDVADFQTSSLTLGTHTITAEYQGDAAFQGSPMSAAVTQMVTQAATRTVVSSSANPSVIRQPVTFTAHVSAWGSPVTAGSVTFDDGVTPLGAASLDSSGSATLTVSALAVGTHTITAAYGGSTDYLPGTSTGLAQVVNRGSTTLTLSSAAAAPATCQTGRTNCDPDDNGHAGAVEKRGQPGTPDQGSACPGGFGGPHLSPGAFGTVSGAVYGIVQVPSGPDTSVACQAITLTATVAAVPPATGAPTGTVTFTDGTARLGSASLTTTGGVTTASLTVSSLPAGAQTITATYSGDATFQGSSGTITQKVRYIFVGLLPPLSGTHAVNPNATVPVAFTLLNGTGQVVRNATATLSVDGQAPVAFQFRGDRYQYDLRLRNLGIGGGTVNLTIQVNDGSTHTFALTLAAPDGSSDHGH